MAKSRSNSDAGSTLVEVIFATGILTVGLVSLAQLFAISTKNNINARTQSYAVVLAQQKMEQLRALTWGFDNLNLPLSDTTTNTALPVESPTGGTGLSPSPADALRTNTDGYVDYVDAAGNVLGGGLTMPTGTAYIRRWSIEPLPMNPNDTMVIQVLVTNSLNRGSANESGSVARLPQEARIVTVKTRKAQ